MVQQGRALAVAAAVEIAATKGARPAGTISIVVIGMHQQLKCNAGTSDKGSVSQPGTAFAVHGVSDAIFQTPRPTSFNAQVTATRLLILPLAARCSMSRRSSGASGPALILWLRTCPRVMTWLE